jgi:O-antigen ligase
MATTPRATRLRDRVSFAAFSIALAWAIFQYGGVAPATWNICLLMVALAAAIHWLSPPTPQPIVGRFWQWALLLLPALIGFQALPLPLFLLRFLSPARAVITDSLAVVMPPVRLAALSVAPAVTFASLLRVIAYTLVFLSIRNLAGRIKAQQPWLIVAPLIAVGALEAALGLWQHAQRAQVTGTYVNKNHFAGLLEMTLPLTVACAAGFRGSSRALKIGGAVLVVLVMSAALLDSLSRMGFASGLAGLSMMAVLVVWAKLRGWRRWLTLFTMAALSLFLLVFLPPEEMIVRLAGLVSTDAGTQEARLPIWRDTLHLIASYPLFGCGLGAYETAFLKYQTSVVDRTFTYAHNDYLQAAAETGATGCLILVALILPVSRRAFRAALRGHDWNTRYLGWGCAGAITAIALHSLADFNMYVPANAMLLAWILGIAASLRLPHESTQPEPRLRRFALILGGVLFCYAPLWIVFTAVFSSNLHAESVFCQIGICDTGAVVTAQTIAHGGQVTAVPAPILAHALRRDPNLPGRWCDLGDSLARAGDTAGAAYCYTHALNLGPDIPPILMRAAGFYHSLHEDDHALPQFARVMGLTATYDPVIFDWFQDQHIPLPLILTWGIDGNQRAAQAYLSHLIDLDQMSDALEAWNWMAYHNYAGDKFMRRWLDYLMSKGKYEIAAEAWARHLGPRRAGYLESNWIYNGDFESEPSGVIFDWRIDPREGVEVSQDSSIAHMAAHSLRIQFDGRENLNFNEISQTAVVRPGNYRFEAFLRTENITTDQGVGFHIFDPAAPSRLDVWTEAPTGTHDWTRIERTLSVAPGTSIVQIQIVRRPSLRFDNQIRGTVWIDGVVLAKL